MHLLYGAVPASAEQQQQEHQQDTLTASSLRVTGGAGGVGVGGIRRRHHHAILAAVATVIVLSCAVVMTSTSTPSRAVVLDAVAVAPAGASAVVGAADDDAADEQQPSVNVDSVDEAENNLINAMGQVGAEDTNLSPRDDDESDAPVSSALDNDEQSISSAMSRIGSGTAVLGHHGVNGADDSTTQHVYASSKLMSKGPGLIAREVQITQKMQALLRGEDVDEEGEASDSDDDSDGAVDDGPLPTPPVHTPQPQADDEEEESSDDEEPEPVEETTAAAPPPTTAAAAPPTTAAAAPPPTTAAAAPPAPPPTTAAAADASPPTTPPALQAPPPTTIATLDTTNVGGFLAGASYDETSRARYIMVTMIGILFLFGAYTGSRAIAR